MKYQLWDMSWKEAEEAFKKSDTAIVPVGTLHGHGPTPISIDASSVEKLADEVGKRTGLLVLPVMPYGEDEKMKCYPGSIAISPNIIEGVYTDICRSLHRNGIRKVIFLNGHGGNCEALIRTGGRVREFGMLIAIVEWWKIGQQVLPDLFPVRRALPAVFMQELAVAVAIEGKDVADVGRNGYKGEWGDNPTKKIFGDKIRPIRFNDFDYKGGQVIIPMEAWDLDLEGPPNVSYDDLGDLSQKGQEMIKRLADYIADFAKEFERIDVSSILKASEPR
jgi:creatinine amidohydrolase